MNIVVTFIWCNMVSCVQLDSILTYVVTNSVISSMYPRFMMIQLYNLPLLLQELIQMH